MFSDGFPWSLVHNEAQCKRREDIGAFAQDGLTGRRKWSGHLFEEVFNLLQRQWPAMHAGDDAVWINKVGRG